MTYRVRYFSIGIAIALACTSASFGQVAKQPEYTRQDVLTSLTKQSEEVRTRGICIGTKEKCAKEQPPAKPEAQAPIKGFDMLLTFELGSAKLSDAAKNNLDVVAEALTDGQLQTQKFRVEGHTDARGRDQYNELLSTERAEAVVNYLEQKNVPADKLQAIGFGKRVPRTTDPFDPENRRVELKLAVQ
ncbi:OmpA family protein [Rhizobium laguerreae]|uniref:OmpA family protein n=1 Tax=Rhizobium laguerreae TaxID=1076926 RepID=UPI001C91D03F|nr:OmpA family protein [Rhizobium laguerreae]MBY3347978.1 OmpA family protein [Rhizobium laguerreae]MBY3354941.1 OmpA family protein [Rhizobium laguerreae]MBY3376246.1 OmpA family protein [Rhizobium laguerreae]MBY3431245.1 OmpA family protein [Rhizobium laguerreae]MBY3439861.1 OmpA family protein [Rhizobium laguerreae]